MASTGRRRKIAIYGGSFNPITDAHLTMMAAIIHSRAADEVWVLPCGERPDKPTLKSAGEDRSLMCHLAIESTFTGTFPIKICPIEYINGGTAYQTVDLFFAHPDPETHAKYPTLHEFTRFSDDAKETSAWLRRGSSTAPHEFVFACGSDLLESMPTWNPTRGNWYEQMGFVVFPRPGSRIPESWIARENVRVLGLAVESTPSVFCDSNLSSSEIRRRIAGQLAMSGSSKGALKARLGNYMYLAEGMLPQAVIKFILSAGLLHDDADGDAEVGGDGAAAAVAPPLMMRQHSTDYEVQITPVPAGAPHVARRIGVLGGSFDPITFGHLKIAAEAIHSQVVDEVWVVPCGARPDKPSLRRSFNDRWLMCSLAVNHTFSHDFGVKVVDVERPSATVPRAMQTYELLALLTAKHPSKEFYFIAGTDLLPSMPTWSSAELKATVPLAVDWFRRFSFIVKNRPGYELPVEGGWWSDTPAEGSAVNRNIHLMSSGAARWGGEVISTEMSSSLLRSQLDFAQPGLVALEGGEDVMLKIEALCPLPVVSFIRRYRHYH